MIQTPEGFLEKDGYIAENTTRTQGEFIGVLSALKEVPDNVDLHLFCDYTPVVDDLRTLWLALSSEFIQSANFGLLDSFTDTLEKLKLELQRFNKVQIDWLKWDTDNLHYHRVRELAEAKRQSKTPPICHPLTFQSEKIIGFSPNIQYMGCYNEPIRERLEYLGFHLYKGDLQRIVRTLFNKKQRKQLTLKNFQLPDDSTLMAAATKLHLLFLGDLKKLDKTKTYQVWCDGSFFSQGNKGGWGSVIVTPDKTISEKSGRFTAKSSIEAELWGIVFSLKEIPDNASVELFCDCYPVIEATQCLAWKKQILGCLNKYENIIQELTREIGRLEIILPRWVKGHSSHILNNRADALARTATNQED